jgi:copper(I)-binding protein
VSPPRRAMLALPLVLLLPAAAGADDPMVTHAWAPPSLAGGRNGVAYFTLVLPSGPPDTLLGASTPVAGKAELHRDETKEGIMSMRPAAPLPLKPGDTLALAPGGLHLMLMGLKQPLKPGDRFPITLSFEHRAPVTVEATVEAASPTGHMR